MIRITSKRHNFRRCGMAHPKGPAEYPDNKFSKKDLSILRAEPMLTVEVIKDQKSEVGGQKSEVGGQKSEVKDQKTVGKKSASGPEEPTPRREKKGPRINP